MHHIARPEAIGPTAGAIRTFQRCVYENVLGAIRSAIVLDYFGVPAQKMALRSIVV